MAQETRKPANQTPEGKVGPFLARVISHLDPTNMGGLEVELLREVGNDTGMPGQVQQVRYMSPFYGVTSMDFVTSTNDYNNTQKSYGMWFVPPDVGTIVMVIFIEGDPRKGYWIGCVPDEKMNFMIPGMAATKFAVGGNGTDRVPTAEYNKKAQTTTNDSNHYPKPVHPFKSVLDEQGLIKDDIRGITTSSARREVPSAVFGISTPGPVDKSQNAKKGNVGKATAQANVFVSRLGGSSFVMDDGDDKFLRKGHASLSGPEYAAVEQNGTGGNVGIPHNELIRLRTRTGHQILLHNSEDLIYIGNARGTTWIELTSNGKIDIFAQDSISIHTQNDLNVTAGRNINFNANGSINMNAKVNINCTSGKDTNIKAGTNANINGSSIVNVSSSVVNVGGGTTNLSGTINSSKINGEITHAATANHAVDSGHGGSYSPPGAPGAPAGAGAASIPSRVPEHEPWIGHENLSPLDFTPDKTGNVEYNLTNSSEYYHKQTQAPTLYQKYTTVVDTFEKITPPEQ